MHQAQWSPERPLPPPVSLASQSHHERPPEVTCTSRGNPGFPASTRERPRETVFNTSRGQIPLPWLGRNDALPLATRMETRIPWHPSRGSLTSPSFLLETAPWGRRSRTTPRLPRHRKMKPFPATASQEKSHVRNWRWKRYLAPLRRPHKVPRHPGLPGEEHRSFPAPLPLSPFYPPDLDRRVDSPALSGRGSRPSGRTSG